MGYHFLPQEIFPTQGSNPHLLHCRRILYTEPGSLIRCCNVKTGQGDCSMGSKSLRNFIGQTGPSVRIRPDLKNFPPSCSQQLSGARGAVVIERSCDKPGSQSSGPRLGFDFQEGWGGAVGLGSRSGPGTFFLQRL